MGSFIRIGLGIEEGESSLCGGAPMAVIPNGILKCPDPACTHPKTYLYSCTPKVGPTWSAYLIRISAEILNAFANGLDNLE